ncbi:MAG TPA: ABC transporter ATP-binding protein [Candidatus Dormibacteraeota bacterium]|nr:ABC transporter ATP-binding protein [Candidatus Dormibacteraeota bacterium]
MGSPAGPPVAAPRPEAPDVELTGISKRFGATEVLRGIDLTVGRGELVCLLGPSGCGKTTLLRILAGLVHPDAGRVRIRGRDVTHMPAYERQLGLVFQSYALFPHMTVRDNVAFGLDARRIRGPEVGQRIARVLELVHLGGLDRRYPRQLSGGQQQRVALARALVLNPDVLLLDEPLSNLDARLRQEVRDEIRALQQETGITTVLVTHDQEEALTMSDRIVVLQAGVIVQSGRPLDVYRAPRDLFVAGFLGDANALRGRVERGGVGVVFITSRGLVVALDASRGGAAGSAAILLVRPEAIEIGRGTPAPAGAFAGAVIAVRYRGATVDLGVRLDSGDEVRVLKTLPGYHDLQAAERIWVRWDARDGVLLPDEAARA